MFLLFEGFSKLHHGREEDQSKLFQAIMQHRLNSHPKKLANWQYVPVKLQARLDCTVGYQLQDVHLPV